MRFKRFETLRPTLAAAAMVAEAQRDNTDTALFLGGTEPFTAGSEESVFISAMDAVESMPVVRLLCKALISAVCAF